MRKQREVRSVPTRWNGTEVNFCAYCGKKLQAEISDLGNMMAVCPSRDKWFGLWIDYKHSIYLITAEKSGFYDTVTGERLK